MVQGVDCWLNTPRRPLEASGTSGMKAAANGALNISISDGWWAEAELLGEVGWTIGRDETYASPDEQDLAESEMLYELFEREVVPMHYDLARDGLPRGWIERMKNAIRYCAAEYNTHRMVQDYAEKFYLPASHRRAALRENDRKRSKALTDWKSKVAAAWPQVHFVNVESGPTEDLEFGSTLEITADLVLNGLIDEDVNVEIYVGNVDPYGRITDGSPVAMTTEGSVSDNVYRFRGALTCDATGERGFAVRAVPSHPDLMNDFETTRIVWA
jgi:starch phosphorylase